MYLSGFDTVYMKFQFHKVRLKVFAQMVVGEQADKFQFHKVRLKVFDAILFPCPLLWFQFHKVRLKGISRNRSVNFSEFQFHKVRLKVSHAPYCEGHIIVSIQQGTIKRESRIEKEIRITRFNSKRDD